MKWLIPILFACLLVGCGAASQGPPVSGTVDAKYVMSSFAGGRSFYVQIKTVDGEYESRKVTYRCYREVAVGDWVTIKDAAE